MTFGTTLVISFRSSVTLRVLVGVYRRFGTTYKSLFHWMLDLEDRNEGLSPKRRINNHQRTLFNNLEEWRRHPKATEDFNLAFFCIYPLRSSLKLKEFGNVLCCIMKGWSEWRYFTIYCLIFTLGDVTWDSVNMMDIEFVIVAAMGYYVTHLIILKISEQKWEVVAL